MVMTILQAPYDPVVLYWLRFTDRETDVERGDAAL